MVKELTDLAGQHEQIAENMSSTVLKDMQTAVQEVKQERKRVNERHYEYAVFVYACVLSPLWALGL